MTPLLKELSEFARQPFEQAFTAPPAIYSSAELHALEQEKIFATEWQCVGRAAEIPNVGDYLTTEIAGTALIVVRQADLSVKALSNVCLHRCAKLLSGEGCVRSIVCPYHAWAYKLNGQLSGTRHMEQTEGFAKQDLRLPEMRCEIWQGFIYISLSESTPCIGNLLQDFAPLLEPYQLENYVHGFTYEERWPVNWKCFVENYLDAYHIFKVHKNSFGVYGNFEGDTHLHDGGEHYTYHLIDGDEDFPYRANPADAVAHPENKYLPAHLRAQTVLAAVFPNQTMQVQPDILWYVLVQPDGVDHFKMRWSVSFAPEIIAEEEKGQQFVEDTRAFLLQVNAEDEAILPAVYSGTKDPQAVRSRYSYLERNVFRFGCYLAGKVS